jgi:hypothetical protein
LDCLRVKVKPKIKKVNWEEDLKKTSDEEKPKQREIQFAQQERASVECNIKTLEVTLKTMRSTLNSEIQLEF